MFRRGLEGGVGGGYTAIFGLICAFRMGFIRSLGQRCFESSVIEPCPVFFFIIIPLSLFKLRFLT